jgi:serine phosphatase RsbU (regulator of sigma subunit)
VKLAGQIHRTLAPAIDARAGEFDFCGDSNPSGVMGGDLLDLVARGEGWLCYLADVSGHGVAAGVVMGVVKSAARTWLATGVRDGGDGMLPSLNRVLLALLPPENYVTFAALRSLPGGTLRFAAAGHPPLLHFHAADGAVTRHEMENFPLGLFPAVDFAAGQFTCAPGDTLALFTDGLTDVFDGHGREFGLEGLEAALAAAGRLPLPQARDAIVAAARAFGPQSDDQTLLLLRRRA